jgi:hypothetical protein
VEEMSAYQDKDQVVKFYYGNAIKDLEAFLPRDDPRYQTGSTSPTDPVEQTLSSVEATLSQLQEAHRELSYLVQDLGRMIKRS